MQRAAAPVLDPPPVPGAAAGLALAVTAGPDAGSSHSLPSDRVVLGRAASAGVSIADASVEAHHVLLDGTPVGRPDARVRLAQLAGRRPVFVDGAPAPTGALSAGSVLEVGSSRIECESTIGVQASTPPSGVLHRVSRQRSTSPAPVIELDRAASDRAGVDGAGVDGAGVDGAGVDGGTELNRLADRIAAAASECRSSLIRRGVADAAPWQRRPDHGDAFEVSIGIGEACRPPEFVDPLGRRVLVADLPIEWQPAAVAAEMHDDVPVMIDLGAETHRIVAVSGSGGVAAIRAIVTRLAWQAGPADWQLLSLLADSEAAWTDLVPHARTVDLGSCPSAVADERRLVVITDDPQLLESPDSSLRRLLDRRGEVTVLVAVGSDATIPSLTTSMVEIGARWRGTHTIRSAPNPAGALRPVRLHVAGFTVDTAVRWLSMLADLVDPLEPAIVARPGRGDRRPDARSVSRRHRGRRRWSPGRRRAGRQCLAGPPCAGRGVAASRQVGRGFDGMRRGQRSAPTTAPATRGPRRSRRSSGRCRGRVSRGPPP